MDIDELKNKAEVLYNLLMENINCDKCKVEIVDDYSEVGGGSLPLEKMPTRCIRFELSGLSVSEFERHLREYKTPIITRVYKDKVFIDIRTVREDEFNIIVDGIVYALRKLEGVQV